eukprot:CAMPEP_0172392632 /NCGR_PEP_ID=MMETSP1061-20121228/8704_1 /TAXON_ID=37318 /ORGANISM="Pseudo-nitzschia pungens, Strain cf. pungens" /LENGTH=952 /DNA_ID=CAMNT_0013123505 /DNA_START=276 /DNA_END=3134 /DNA_ORIENTATION=+
MNAGATSTNGSHSRSNSALHNTLAVSTHDQPQRTISPPDNANTNSNNQHHLLEQLRLITARLQGGSSAASPVAPGVRQAPTTTGTTMQQGTSPPKTDNQQTMLLPEVARSNVGIVSTNTAVGRLRVGNSAVNAIDVDSCDGKPSVIATNATKNNSSPQPSTAGSDPQADLFPYILHGMLDDVERMGQTNIVSWNADGKSFRIHDPDSFVSLLLEKYLKKYIGGIASRFTQFRSDLKDWGFEDAVDGNRMGETFTHHCFQRGQPNLCRYMRCGRKTEEQIATQTPSPRTAMPQPVRVQAQPQPQPQGQSPSSATNAIPTANAVALGNAAQLLIQQAQTQAQAQAQAKQQQQQALQQQALQQQQQAMQVQALLNGLTNGSNPVATMILNQLAQQQQQQQRRQQQQQLSSVMAAAAALQRQQQQQQQQKTFVAANSAPSSQNPSASPMTMGPTGLVQSPAPSATARPLAASNTRINAPINHHRPMRELPNAVPAVPNQMKQVKATTAPAATSVSAKRAAFLNKRSKATGAAYRNPNKKQKRANMGSSAASVIKNRKKNLALKPSMSSSVIKSGSNTSKLTGFTLNEDFKQKDVPDLLFPWKLHDMLDDVELNEDIKANVISWQADGVSFNIHNKDRFVNEVLPRYFENIPKEWDSFMNSLSGWGFVRFTSGTQKGAFIHRLLVKGKRSICKQMRINGKTVSDWMKQHGQFLGRLHALLAHAEKQGKQDIVSWTPDGKKFTVHDPSAFMNSVFPLYFDSLTYSSFEQKLRRWGFMRSPANHTKIDKETKLENAVYSHPQFVRGKRPNLVWVKSETKIPRTLQQHNFLVRLRVMLSDASRHGHQFVVSWAPHGKAFMIHDRPYFSNNIMPNYFKSKFTSFRQSLRNHGFAQIGGNGWDEGAYFHKLFIREEPQLCQGLTQDQMKKAMPQWIPVEDEPNFYPEDNHKTPTPPSQSVAK